MRTLCALGTLCCALLVLTAAVRAADDAEDCEEQPLGWLARYGLEQHLADAFPWLVQPILPDSLYTCAAEADPTVNVEFEPHLRGPGWERSWSVSCERLGLLDWGCEFPQEETFVYLSNPEEGVPIASDVSPAEAIEALAAIVIQSAGPGIADPFDPKEPFRDLTIDSMLSVTREVICDGLFVPVQLDPESPTVQLCVERERCSARAGTCPLSARVQGTTQ